MTGILKLESTQTCLLFINSFAEPFSDSFPDDKCLTTENHERNV